MQTKFFFNLSRNIVALQVETLFSFDRLKFYFLQQILVLLLVLPLKLQLVSQWIWIRRLWLAVAKRGNAEKKNMADGEEQSEFEVGQ